MPPTAVTGFSFQTIAGRPVTDARIVQTIGQRAPAPAVVDATTRAASPPRMSTETTAQNTPDNAPHLSWLSPSLCLMDLLERQIACGGDLLVARHSLVDETPCAAVTEPTPECAGTLTCSPPCNNLEDFSQLLPDEKHHPSCVAPEASFQCESSPMFDVCVYVAAAITLAY